MENLSNNPFNEPEKHLLAAVVMQAMTDFRKRPGDRPEILKWIRGKREGRLDFDEICLFIGIDPVYIREHFDKLMQEYLKERFGER